MIIIVAENWEFDIFATVIKINQTIFFWSILIYKVQNKTKKTQKISKINHKESPPRPRFNLHQKDSTLGGNPRTVPFPVAGGFDFHCCLSSDFPFCRNRNVFISWSGTLLVNPGRWWSWGGNPLLHIHFRKRGWSIFPEIFPEIGKCLSDDAAAATVLINPCPEVVKSIGTDSPMTANRKLEHTHSASRSLCGGCGEGRPYRSFPQTWYFFPLPECNCKWKPNASRISARASLRAENQYRLECSATVWWGVVGGGRASGAARKLLN